MRLRDFLIEANILNDDFIQTYLSQILMKNKNSNFHDAEYLKKWYFSSIIKFIKSSDPSTNNEFFQQNFTKVTDISTDSPVWLKTALEKNQDVYKFKGSADLTGIMSHLIDWLNDLLRVANISISPNEQFFTEKTQRKKDAQIYLNSIKNNKLDFLTGVDASKSWYKNNPIPVSASEQEPDAIVEMEFPDGYSWKFLSTNECLEKEGSVMGHCVGSNYRYPDLENEDLKILSLRTPKNESVGTMMISVDEPPNILEIKGKQNQPMSPIFANYVRKFITEKNGKLELHDKNDVRSLGWMIVDKKIFKETDFREWFDKNVDNLDIGNILFSNTLWNDKENYIFGNYDKLTPSELSNLISKYEKNLQIKHSDGHLFLSNNIAKLYFIYNMQILPENSKTRVRNILESACKQIHEELDDEFYYMADENHGVPLMNLENISTGPKKLVDIEKEKKKEKELTNK